MNEQPMRWILDEYETLNLRFEDPRVGRVHAWIAPRPAYCDRGHWMFNCDAQLNLDGSDGFPRYFMSLETAILEAEAWLRWRLHQQTRTRTFRHFLLAENGRPADVARDPEAETWSPEPGGVAMTEKRCPARQFAGIEALGSDRSFVAGWLWGMAAKLAAGEPTIDDDEIMLRAAAHLFAADAGCLLPGDAP